MLHVFSKANPSTFLPLPPLKKKKDRKKEKKGKKRHFCIHNFERKFNYKIRALSSIK